MISFDHNEDRRREGPAACPVCDAGVDDGDLCLTHRMLAQRDTPEVLVKKTPPKYRIEAGHGSPPDWLWTVLLVLLVLVALRWLGAI